MKPLWFAIPLVLAAATLKGMTISKSVSAPTGTDVFIGFDTVATGSQIFFPMARGGGSSGVGGGESAFGQTFKTNELFVLDKITFKVRITQPVDNVPLLLWFGKGFTGQLSSGMSSLMLTPEENLPAGMGVGETWYLTLDIADQVLTGTQTYAFMPRFAAGGSGGNHPEMEVGFMGTYAYPDGAAFTFDGIGYDTILNNEMVFFLHGEVQPTDPCDLNLDGRCDTNDVDALTRIGDLVNGVAISESNSRFDLDASGTIDVADLDTWLADAGAINGFAGPYLRGDADLERDVDITDFGRLATYFDPGGLFVHRNYWSNGDFDGDSDIDITDFNTLVTNFNPGGYDGVASALTYVPEPASVVLLGFGSMLVMCRRR